MRESSPMFRFPKTPSTKATGSTSRLLLHPLSRKHIEINSWKSSKENIRAMDSLNTQVMGRQSTRTPSANLGPVRSIDCLFLSSESFVENFQSFFTHSSNNCKASIPLQL